MSISKVGGATTTGATWLALSSAGTAASVAGTFKTGLYRVTVYSNTGTSATFTANFLSSAGATVGTGTEIDYNSGATNDPTSSFIVTSADATLMTINASATGQVSVEYLGKSSALTTVSVLSKLTTGSVTLTGSARVLCIGGGGGAGSPGVGATSNVIGGGAGSGYSATGIIAAGTYTATIGGAGTVASSGGTSAGGTGGTTTFSTLTAAGGAGGPCAQTSTTGGAGGSGGAAGATVTGNVGGANGANGGATAAGSGVGGTGSGVSLPWWVNAGASYGQLYVGGKSGGGTVTAPAANTGGGGMGPQNNLTSGGGTLAGSVGGTGVVYYTYI